VLAVVVRVERVVRRAGVVGVPSQNRRRDCARVQRDLDVALPFGNRGEKGESVEGGSLVILWVGGSKGGHAGRVRRGASHTVALTEEPLDRVQVPLLPVGRRTARAG
jgi:hypothetical protein